MNTKIIALILISSCLVMQGSQELDTLSSKENELIPKHLAILYGVYQRLFFEYEIYTKNSFNIYSKDPLAFSNRNMNVIVKRLPEFKKFIEEQALSSSESLKNKNEIVQDLQLFQKNVKRLTGILSQRNQLLYDHHNQCMQFQNNHYAAFLKIAEDEKKKRSDLRLFQKDLNEKFNASVCWQYDSDDEISSNKKAILRAKIVKWINECDKEKPFFLDNPVDSIAEDE